MNMPGFTAEASAYATTNHYCSAIAVEVTKSASVQPQYVLPPWTPCLWFSFCCTEFGDQSCCDRWHLQCIPE
jgi:hypothetical protein